ncbi:MAG: DUF4279 domain-containing protein [Roseovarius sp.]
MSDLGFKISFRITHPEENLKIAAEKLEMKPFRIWRSGDQRQTPKGKKLDGKHDSSYCCVDLDGIEGHSVSEKLEKFLEKADKHHNYWVDLANTGGNLSIVVYNEGDGRFVDVFNWRLLEHLSRLKISLGFEC